MKNARIIDNAIVEILPDGDLTNMFHPDILATVQEVFDESEVGMVWDGAAWAHPYTGPTAESILAQRDRLLAESDWTQTVDAPLTAATKRMWRTYRQALRDITDQTGFPGSVDWPEQPPVSSDSDLATETNSKVVEEISMEETLGQIGELVDSMEDGTEKETLNAPLTVLRG